MSCLSHFYRDDGLSVLARINNLPPILHKCKHNGDSSVNVWFKIQRHYVTCCGLIAITAA